MANSSSRTSLDHALQWRWSVPALLLLVALPFIANAVGEGFYIALASRILIFALAATSLNFILGFGGMVSFGHAAFVGVGAYSVAILTQMGITDAWVLWPAAMVVSAVFALLIGAISLRTQGVYFIMITLAFAQMIYYLTISIKAYGGDDGLSLAGRSQIPFIDIHDDTSFYYVVLAVCVASLYAVARVLNARFGHVLQAIRENEVRMQALGYAVYRYKLVAFVLAGALAGLAGATKAIAFGLATLTDVGWQMSGEVVLMTLLGGMGTLIGPAVGAAVIITMENYLASLGSWVTIIMGCTFVTCVLVFRRGIVGEIEHRFGRKG